MIAGIGSVGGILAIVWAARVGRRAISDYRTQKLADKEIEAADAALSAAYRAFDAVTQMQARWVPGEETEQAKQALVDAGAQLDGLDEKERRAHLMRGVIYRRAQFFKSDFDAIFEALPSAKIYFGAAAVELLKKFPAARNTILGSADMLPMVANGEDYDRVFSVQVRQDVFGTPEDKPNSVRDSITAALGELEVILLPKLRPEKV